MQTNIFMALGNNRLVYKCIVAVIMIVITVYYAFIVSGENERQKEYKDVYEQMRMEQLIMR